MVYAPNFGMVIKEGYRDETHDLPVVLIVCSASVRVSMMHPPKIRRQTTAKKLHAGMRLSMLEPLEVRRLAVGWQSPNCVCTE